MCTFDEQKLNKTERKGHVHTMCRCVNYNTINNSCVYRADNPKHDFFFIFVKFHKGSDNLHRKIVTFIKKVKWCIYIAPFPCNMLKGALQ